MKKCASAVPRTLEVFCDMEKSKKFRVFSKFFRAILVWGPYVLEKNFFFHRQRPPRPLFFRVTRKKGSKIGGSLVVSGLLWKKFEKNRFFFKKTYRQRPPSEKTVFFGFWLCQKWKKSTVKRPLSDFWGVFLVGFLRFWKKALSHGTIFILGRVFFQKFQSGILKSSRAQTGRPNFAKNHFFEKKGDFFRRKKFEQGSDCLGAEIFHILKNAFFSKFWKTQKTVTRKWPKKTGHFWPFFGKNGKKCPWFLGKNPAKPGPKA